MQKPGHEGGGKKSRLTLYIFIALVLGIALGFVLNKTYVGEENKHLADIENSVEGLKNSIAKYYHPKDSVRVKELTKLQNSIEENIKKNEEDIIRTNDVSLSARNILLKDSLASLNKQITVLYDSSTSSAYKALSAQKAFLMGERSSLLKARDAKLEWFSLLADIFLRLIKMIVAPLVFTTLVVGVARLGDIKSVGRIGGKTLLWFISASFVSLLLGLLLVNLFQPGANMHLPLPEANATGVVDKAALSLKDFLYHVFPASFIEAMAKNEILQIVVFSLFFGVAAAALGEVAEPMIKLLDVAAHIILKVTAYVMNFAPVAVFGAMVAIIAKQGLGILKTYSIFIGEFYFGLLLLWIILALAGAAFLGKRILRLINRIKEPIILAFSTSSSEAAFPKTMMELERFGCKDKIVSFVLPLGYSFNLDGSMMYMTFASLFIAQSYGIHLDLPTQLSMLLVLMLTSKGIAGVPRASLVVIAGTLATFNIPEAGLALLLGIDPLLDMGRSATNVLGNSIATAVVSKMEGELEN